MNSTVPFQIGGIVDEKEATTPQAASAEEAVISKPFPRWINRWAFWVFLLCMVSPVVLFALVYQPVYVQAPFYHSVENGEVLVIKVPGEIAALNPAGEAVTLMTSSGGQSGEKKWTGRIDAVKSEGKESRIWIIPEAAMLRQMATSLKEGRGALAGSVLLKKERVRMIEKVFR